MDGVELTVACGCAFAAGAMLALYLRAIDRCVEQLRGENQTLRSDRETDAKRLNDQSGRLMVLERAMRVRPTVYKLRNDRGHGEGEPCRN